MKKYPGVTWLLPVKNAMPYLPEALASIEAQTYRNWTVIAWDNGSTDGSLEVLNEWIPSRLPGVVVDSHPLGLGDSLAEMVKMADTELCARMDGDDVCLPERLERQVDFLVEHPEVAACGSAVRRVDESGRVLSEGPFGFHDHDDILNGMLVATQLAHPTVVFRRDAVLDVGNYRCYYPCVEDYDLWLRLAVKHKLINLEHVLLMYRVHSASVTRYAGRDKVRAAALERLCENAPRLYGLRDTEVRLLHAGKHPCALIALLRAARHLQRLHELPWDRRIRLGSFAWAARRLCGRHDMVTRAFVKCLRAMLARGLL